MSGRIRVNDQVLIVYVALQHLLHGRSKLDLAEELGVSRFKVGRMINQARDLGLVEVVPKLSVPIDVELSRNLKQRFGLEEALVAVAATSSELHTREAIAGVAAAYLSDNVAEDSVLGFGPGRTIIEVCDRIVGLPVCDVVQLTGVATRDEEQSLQAIYSLSRVSKGKMFSLHAPFLATTELAAQAIVSQPSVNQALSRIDRVEMAVLTIGGWPDSSLLAEMLRQLGELDELLEKGAVAEIGTTVLNRDGRVISDIDSRTIGISLEQLQRIPYRIVLGGGEGKHEAMIATLNSGLVEMVVTDAHSALAALENA